MFYINWFSAFWLSSKGKSFGLGVFAGDGTSGSVCLMLLLGSLLALGVLNSVNGSGERHKPNLEPTMVT